MKRLLIGAVILVLVAGCTFPGLPLDPPTGSGGEQVGWHVVWGDSLAWQATGYRQTPDFYADGRHWHVRPGKGVVDLKDEILYSLGEDPAVTVLALGTNDAGFWDGRDGWTPQDEQAWTEVLNAAGGSQIVIVLPHVQLGQVVTQADLDSTDRARAWLSQRPNATIVDWSEYASGVGVLDSGGIHVASGHEGVRYQATVAGDPL